MFDLSGKGALVTGATGGIGGATARLLHAQGAKVVISGTREEKLAELVNELGDNVFTAPCDLMDRAAVSGLYARAEELAGQIDIVVNNAGITKDNLFLRMKDEEWDDVINVNLSSAFAVCRGALKAMMRRRYGRIINISSISGVVGNPGQGNYSASKAGMIGMSKAMAREIAPRGITVNCIAPGFITTPMTDLLNEKQKTAITQIIPAGALGEPDDIANAVLFLASDEAGYITGQTLNINGGLVMI
ncbi:MAG: 3-oxoacyl-[acyl-carrier-protein] reductase [bacterium]|nr:3-oxoacyl-[acyl-carrier-protein] reductase [bacterium]